MTAARSVDANFASLGASCTAGETELTLNGLSISNIDLRQACAKITAGTVVVMNNGDLTLQAGEQVVLGDSFTVEAGGELTILIQIPVAP